MRFKLLKKTLSLVMCLAMLLTIFPVSSMTAFAATGVPATQAFALKNSNFLNGSAYWHTYIAPWEYGAYNIDASSTTDDDGMLVTVRNTGDFHSWDTGTEVVTYPEWLLDVDQSTTMYAGVNYTASFTLTSSITRNVHFTIESANGSHVYWKADCALTAGQKKTVQYQIPATETDYDVVVRIQLGHNALDAGNGYSAHTVRIHEAALEVPGARDEYLMAYDTSVKTGSAQYNVNVVAGESYKVQFAARAESSAVAAVTLGGQTVVSGIELDNYTQELSYSFVSPVSGNVALRIANVSGGTTHLTNVSFSTVEAEAAMGGICFPTPSIRLNGASLTAVNSKVAYGKNVSFTVNCSNLNAWSAASKTVLVNGEKVNAAVTMSGNTATVSASAFTGEGRYKVAIRANGFETSEGAFVTILPSNGNLLQNSDFDAGFANWVTLFLNGSAEGNIVNNRLKIDVKWWDEWSWDNNPPYTKVDWQIMLNQENVPIEAGKTYTLTFKASSTVNRPILVQFKDKGNGQRVNLTPNEQTYTLTFASTGTENIELQFLFGYMDGVPEDPIHTMYISDIVFAEKGAGGVTYPTILGVVSGAVYKEAVTPSVKNASNYNVFLYKLVNGSYVQQSFNLGDTISTDGEYKITAVDKSNSTLTSSKVFTVSTQIDYSKTYYMIKNRGNSYVMKSYGIGSGAAVIQSLYNKELSQFWTLEDVGGGYYVIRNASSEKVLAIENANTNSGGKIVQEDYYGDAYQQWRLSYESQGYYSVLNRASGLAIDSPWGGSNGTQLQSYTSNSTNAQQWDFVEVDLTSIVKPPVDVSSVEAWKKNTIINPLAGKLNAAGPIFVTWYGLDGAVSYDVYVDGEYQGSVSANGAETYEYEWYSVDVELHNCYIVAVMGSGSKVSSDTCSFYVSKKGVGWGTLYRTEDMNLSWYYHWSMDPAAGTDEDLQFVPMLWGNWDSGNQWLQNPENQKYKTVLGFNEPDWSDQSNVSVSAAIAAWPYFCNSGLRVGSPATAIAPPYSDGRVQLDQGVPDTWFPDFMKEIDADPELFVDFIAIHCYDQSCDAQGFLKMIDDTWEMYHLPIWITEFGVARWDQAMWDGSEAQDKKVMEFMRTVLTGLEERDYVERYAWFPFDPNDAYGGSSGLFDYDTGELTELGELYKSMGVPEGYGDPIPEPNPSEPSDGLNTNLALGKTAFSSDNAISAAAQAVDGNTGSRWESQHGVDPQWMYVDLGASYDVNKVVINWENAAAKSYQVQVSNDAVNWKTVYSTDEGNAGVDTVEFATENARYVRIYGTERTTDYGYSIWELEVYYEGEADNSGDVDMDGSVTVLDIAKLKPLILAKQWSDEELARGDLDKDGKLSVVDIMLLKNLILNQKSS